MTVTSVVAPSEREVLVNLGNRYVVFGSEAGLPKPLHFGPDSDLEVLPKVAMEIDVAEERIARTLQVHGMKRAAPGGVSEADVELLDEDGNQLFVEIKVRERDPKVRDKEQAHQRLTEFESTPGRRLEIWYFNIERTRLVIMYLDRFCHPDLATLVPRNVWEKTPDAVPFEQRRVEAEVEDWVDRVGALYDEVQTWLADRADLRFERSRSVILSEELMQRFAVDDRDIPVLDILDADQVVASFVPRGLWLVGSRGRIDVITRDRTVALVALGEAGTLEWRLVDPEDRKRIPFDKDALRAILMTK
jgi:hypothetical protein